MKTDEKMIIEYLAMFRINLEPWQLPIIKKLTETTEPTFRVDMVAAKRDYALERRAKLDEYDFSEIITQMVENGEDDVNEIRRAIQEECASLRDILEEIDFSQYLQDHYNVSVDWFSYEGVIISENGVHKKPNKEVRR